MLIVTGGGNRYRGHYRGRRGLAFGYYRPKASGSKDRRSETGEDSGSARRSTRSTGAELIPFFFLSLAHGSSVYSPTGSVQRVEAHAPQGSTCEIKKFKPGRSSQEWLPERHEAGAKKDPWGRSAERAGCGLQAVLPQQKATWAEFTRRRSISLTHPPTCSAQEYRQATWRWQRKGDTPKVPQGQKSLATRRRKR